MIWDNVGWCQVISSSPKYFELHCKDLWIFSGDFKRSEGDLRWCQVMSGSIIKYQMISGNLTWTEVILEWSQVISANFKWSGTVSGDPRWSQALPSILTCTAKISGYFRWYSEDLRSSEVKLTWSHVMSGSIIKYQMIWGDLSSAEVILRDLRWSQLDLKWSGTTSGDPRWSSSYPKCCELNCADLRIIFFDITRSEVIWGKLTWSEIMSGR